MPGGRSTFSKRQKEQTRQQKQRDKAERRVQRKAEKPAGGTLEDEELQRHADAVLCLMTPYDFAAVGQWYRRFDQTSDDEVRLLLERSAEADRSAQG